MKRVDEKKIPIILHMATSIDGFIADLNGGSDWVSQTDSALFKTRCIDAGCVVVGRTTFDQFYGDLFPISDVLNIVITSKDASFGEENVCVASSPDDAVDKARERGISKILLAGGGRTNASFLQGSLIDEMYLTVHPIILGKGIGIFGEYIDDVINLDLIDSSSLGDGLTQLHYRRPLYS